MILELFKEKIEKADSRIPCVIDFLKNYEYSSSDFGMFFLEPETLKSQSINLKHDKTHERTLKLLYIAPVDVSWAPEFDIKYQITFLENLMKQLSKDEDILKEINFPDELIMNYPKKLINHFHQKGKLLDVDYTNI